MDMRDARLQDEILEIIHNYMRPKHEAACKMQRQVEHERRERKKMTRYAVTLFLLLELAVTTLLAVTIWGK